MEGKNISSVIQQFPRKQRYIVSLLSKSQATLTATPNTLHLITAAGRRSGLNNAAIYNSHVI